MVKAPTKTPTKAKAANATGARPAQAKKVEAPANSAEPEGGENAPPKDPEPTKPADPAGGSNSGDKPNPDLMTGQTDPDLAAKESGTDLAEKAYQQGYSDGFSAALDGETAPGTTAPEGEPFTGYGEQSTAYAGDDRLALVAIAMATPSNQRKGGLLPLVDRLQAFLDGVDPGDRYSALMLMRAISKHAPADIANGRFENLVREGIAAVNGYAPAPIGGDASDNRAAMRRLEAELNEEDQSQALDTGEKVDPNDPNAASSAAARMAALEELGL